MQRGALQSHMALDKETLEQLQLLRTEIVEPTVKHLNEAIDAVVAPLTAKQAAQDFEITGLKQEVKDLKSIWTKVATGAIVWSTLLGLLIAFAKSKLIQWFGRR